MAVWGTFRRCSATVANRRLDIAQCVVDRVAEKRRRPIYVTVGVPVAAPWPRLLALEKMVPSPLAYATRVRTFGPRSSLYLTHWFLLGTLPAQLHCRILVCCAGGAKQ